MLWIGLYLPLLSLESLAATLPPELRQMPLALVEARQISHANASARKLGVKPGQRRATALGLVPQLVTAPADALRDAQALQAVLHACLAFTPAVTALPPHQVLLEVQASLRYFGGFEPLLQRLRAALAPLGHETRYASAPTAQGAALLARMSPPGRPKGEYRSAQHEGTPMSPPGRPKGEYRSAQHEGTPVSPPGRPKGEYRSAQHEGTPVSPPGRHGPQRGPSGALGEYRSAQREATLINGPVTGLHCPDLRSLQRTLSIAPVWLLGPGREHLEALQGMGLRTVADLRGLPRAGLARRFGEALLDELDRAFGERPDPRVAVSLRATFEARLELFARADTSAQVLHGAAVLLERLAAWLSAQHAFVRRFTLQLQHETRSRRADTPPDTAVEIVLAAPSRNVAHLLLLLRERLGRTELVAPALELRLRADEIARAPPPNGELFPTAQGEREGLTRLVERLQARLGQRQVQRLVRVPDHRPERSSALHEVDAGALHLRPARPDTRHGDPGPGGSAGAARSAQGGLITRPVWLIEPPQPLPELGSQPLLDGAPLQLLSGPERIETGWWDQGLAGRDYFIAQTADASLVWVYRLRLPDLGQPALQPQTQLSAPAAQRRLDDHGWYLHGRFG